MKKVKVLILLLLLVSATSNAQEEYRDPGPRFDPPLKSLPVFLDSLKLRRDVRQFKYLKQVYSNLKKSKNEGVYSYDFEIDTTGNLLLEYKSIGDQKEIDLYVRDVFVNYKWRPGYKFNYEKCPVKVIGSLSFFFFTQEKSEILCQLRVITDDKYIVFKEKIDMR